MKVEMSIGDVYDRISILKIKQERITDQTKLENVRKEYNSLVQHFDDIESDILFVELYEVNKVIWDIEDNIRKKEAAKEFDDTFIELARSVYINNDNRALIKRKINITKNSSLTEEKEYVKYNVEV